MDPTILAIESSCDETAASVIKGCKILTNVIAAQSIHEKYGGVVPELASRAHQQHIVPVVTEAINGANITKYELNAVAFTQGPGLLGSLLVGASFAKSMALALQIPLIGVHHMKAHILAHFIEDPKPVFPFLCLTVSGGHTQIVLVEDYLKMTVLGETQDDAVGEAFDKAAKLLGFPYPGGPEIDDIAQTGDPHKYEFPGSSMEGLDFSFSGVKTAFLYFLREKNNQDPDFIERNKPDISASYQHRLVQMLIEKLAKASAELGINEIAIAGGVSANTYLRRRLQKEAMMKGWKVFIPKLEYCTDNAAMIAIHAHYKYLAEEFSPLDVSPSPRLKF